MINFLYIVALLVGVVGMIGALYSQGRPAVTLPCVVAVTAALTVVMGVAAAEGQYAAAITFAAGGTAAALLLGSAMRHQQRGRYPDPEALFTALVDATPEVDTFLAHAAATPDLAQDCPAALLGELAGTEAGR